MTPFANYPTKLLADIAAGTPPDLAAISGGWLGMFVKNNALVDLKPLLSKLRIKGVTPLSGYDPGPIAAATYGGKLVGLPWSATAPAIVYDKTLFDKAGIPYPTPDWTWDDLKNIAAKISALSTKDNPVWGLFPYVASSITYQDPILRATGGQYVGPDGRATGYLNSQKIVDGVKYIADFWAKGYAPPPDLAASVGSLSLLFNDKCAMVLNNGTWILDSALAQNIDVDAKIGHVLPPKPRYITLTVHTLGIPVTAKNKELAAKLALYYSGSEEVFAKSLSVYTPTVIVAAQKKQVALMGAEVVAEYNAIKEANGKRVFTMETNVDGVTMFDVYTQALMSIILGKATPEEAMTKAAQDYDKRVFGN